MIEQRFGFRFINEDTGEDRHSSEYPGILAKTESIPLMPTKRQNKQTIIGRNGQVTFTDGYNNKTPVSNVKILEKRDRQLALLFRELAVWLSGSGILIFDIEPDKRWYAQLLTEIQIDKSDLEKDEFILAWDCEPINESIYTDTVILDSDVLLDSDIPLDGYATEIVGTSSENFINDGTYYAEPIIRFEGTATVLTITNTSSGKTFSITGITSDTTVDVKELEIFDLSGNKAGDFSGDIDFYLERGDNIIQVSGTDVSGTTYIEYRQSYL